MFTAFEIMQRLILAVVLGGLIGLERELRRCTAGLRTHILVAMGSCLIMLISLYVFDIYKDKVAGDPARIAAGVITGIGFLGAGAIIRSGADIRGLTTAASLWIVAAVGLGVGCGFYLGSTFAAIIAFLVLFVLRYLEDRLLK